jgi:hypothetical protein
MFGAIIAILTYNAIIANRDAKMFEAYDAICIEMKDDPRCRYAR